MDIGDLKLQLIDFKNVSHLRWTVRRSGIGLLLMIYFGYAFAFATFLLIPEIQIAGSETVTHNQATALPSAVPAAPGGPDGGTGPFGGLITKTHQYQLALMATFGFLGSLFSVTRTFVLTTNRVDFPAVWYFTRPFLSVLMAWFFYYAFLAGQFVFYSGDPKTVDVKNINLYSLAILAIVAGVFTEQAFEFLRTIANRLFKQQKIDGAGDGHATSRQSVTDEPKPPTS